MNKNLIFSHLSISTSKSKKIQLFSKFQQQNLDLSIPVIYLDNYGYTFRLNSLKLQEIQDFKNKIKFQYYEIQLPYYYDLLQSLVYYGFEFMTQYEITENDIVVNIDNNLEPKITAIKYHNIIKTSISLDGDSSTQISQLYWKCLTTNVHDLIINTHYWLIKQILQHINRRINQEITVVIWGLYLIIFVSCNFIFGMTINLLNSLIMSAVITLVIRRLIQTLIKYFRFYLISYIFKHLITNQQTIIKKIFRKIFQLIIRD